MILTFTPNPAIDVSATVDSLVPNEKSYVFDEKRIPGGNGVNAARIAHRLGAKVLISGFLGGSSGDEFSQLLATEKMPQSFIKIKERTRSNLTVSLKISHQQTRLSFPGPQISSAEFQKALRQLNKIHPQIFILGGSLPPGIKNSDLRKIIADFKARNIITFVDVPGKNLKELLSSGPSFIKPNLTEFQELIGKKVFSIQQVVKEARKLSSLIPLQCISSVEKGALLITPQQVWFGTIPKIKVQSTVGAGDSMVGAMAYILAKKNRDLNSINAEEMLRYGLAAATATLVSRGLTMGTKKSISHYLSSIKLSKLG